MVHSRVRPTQAMPCGTRNRKLEQQVVGVAKGEAGQQAGVAKGWMRQSLGVANVWPRMANGHGKGVGQPLGMVNVWAPDGWWAWQRVGQCR